MKNKFLSDISVQFVKGVGPAKKKLFNNLGIESVEDLMYFFPRRYEDRRNITSLAEVKIGESQTISGEVKKTSARKSYYTKKHVFEAILDDGSGRITCTWFNQQYLNHYFKEGKKVVCFGKVDIYKNVVQMVSPEYEVLDEEDESLSLKRIVPVYPLTRGITQRFLRKTISQCLGMYKEHLVDELPVGLRNKHRFYNIKRSIENLHFPQEFEDQESSLGRISFEEFFFFQISIILRRLSITKKQGVLHKISDAQIFEYIDAFPFELTSAQKRVIKEISVDMKKKSPMLRLLQGDVGSGKTLVATFGCFSAIKNGFQSCIMAPTEILARQHYEKIEEMMENRGWKREEIALLINGIKKAEKDKILSDIKEGKVKLVIGTHSLISDEVEFKNLSFVVIDEQHKFGVRQRALLTAKGTNPDVLIMTATPIPRTLCITLYGDLDVSVIDEMPKGRGGSVTKLYAHSKAADVYQRVKEYLKDGSQAYVVYPIIEESEKTDLKAAEEMYKYFKSDVFKEFSVGLVHGQMKKDASKKVMQQFKDGKIDVLVATTVLEVGVDVPNANVMVVEHAERFGLSQLHQLRGRIGRGEKKSACLLIGEPTTDEGVERLKAIASTSDGFEIARKDLLIRGPGKFFGRHQHGLNELKVANPATQIDILELARKEAIELTEKDNLLLQEKNKHILNVIKKRYPTYLENVAGG